MRYQDKMGSTYNPNEPPYYLIYLNNLYSTSMCLPWPYGGLTPYSVNFLVVPDDSEFDYILEADILYPTHLHEKHALNILTTHLKI